MFKKKPTIKPLSPIRSSDRRKLADQIISDYSLISENTTSEQDQTPEQKAEATAARTALRNSILPENTQSARFTTTVGPELRQVSGTVYVGSQDGHDTRILWFEVDKRTYPSIYTVWRNPDIVPLLHTPEIVVKKLQGGADLMTPGLAGPPFPARAKKSAVVAVAALERPAVPMAVGMCEIDVSALQKAQGAKGRAVENLHWAGDELWSFSTTGKPGQEPPESLNGWTRVLEKQDLTDGISDLAIDDQDEEGGVDLGAARDDDGGAIDAGTPKTDHAATADTDETQELTQKEIDEAFRKAFLYGVHQQMISNPHQKNYGIVYPISQSAVMSTLVQPFLPAFTPSQSQQLQIKKTTWKNIKKFIKSLDKEKLVRCKDQDGNQTVILDIDFQDKTFLDFKPYQLPKKETIAGMSAGRGEEATDKIDVADDALGQKLQVLTSYKPTTKQQSLFAAASGSQTFYTPAEIRELVTSYIESEKLVSETNKRLVKLNPILANSVFDGSSSLDKEVLTKGSVPRDALVDRILTGMAASYSVLRNGADAFSIKPKAGSAPKIQIVLETRSGNKTVTKVHGLEAYHVNPRPLAEELRKVCAGSTSVEPLAGAAKKNEKEVMEVMIQGPQKDAVIKALEKRGVDKRWVEVVDKTKKKK